MPDITIPARHGKAAQVAAGQVIRVINTHGEQVVDTWAFNRHDMTEFMSMEHSRATLRRLIPRVGDALLTNHRRPILTVLEDTSSGIHDTLMAACDRYRYQELGCAEYRRQLHRQSGAGLGGTRPEAARDAEPAQPVHEHPLDRGRRVVIRAAGIHPRLLHQAARRDGPGHRVLGLSAGHPADQRPRRETNRGTFPDRGMIISPTGQPQELIDGKPGVGDDAARVPVLTCWWSGTTTLA